MSRVALLVMLAAVLACVCGCGGSSGGGSQTVLVSIRSGTTNQKPRFVPKNVTVRVNDTVQWINSDTNVHQIVSGTLDPLGDPTVIHVITIGNAGFTPASSEANLGDTVRFTNARSSTFNMLIVDDNGQVISNVTLLTGDIVTFDFPTAGFFTFSDNNNSLVFGTITVFGRPHPSNLFQSQPLPNGGTFRKQFGSAGTFPYFDLDQTDPDKSFMTGTVIVQ